MKKIIVITSAFSRYREDFSGNFGLIERGFNVSVLAPHDQSSKFKEICRGMGF